jgi:hypothetical protein
MLTITLRVRVPLFPETVIM